MRWQFRQALVITSLFLCASMVERVTAQTIVAAPPFFWQQYFKSSGVPNAFGCIFTYRSGSTTPLATYTDFTGNTQNTNPIILDSGGFAGTSGNGMFLQAGVAYRITEKTSGGTNCASGSTIRSIDGIGGGTTVNTTVVTYSPTPSFPIIAQNQLFEITLTGDAVAQPLTAVGIIPPAFVTFQITQDGTGSHSFTWPSNSTGGAPVGQAAGQVTVQSFVWNGTTAEAIGPGMAALVPSLSRDIAEFPGDIVAVANITAGADMFALTWTGTCATTVATGGTIKLCKTGSINWRNDGNTGNQGISQDTSNRLVLSHAGGVETTGTIPDIFLGGTSASFPRLKRNATAVNFRLGDDSADAPITASTLGLSGLLTSTSATATILGNEVSTPSNPAASKQLLYPKASHGYCSLDSAGNEYCPLKGAASLGLIQHKRLGSPTCQTGNSSFDQCTETLTWPVTFTDTNYTAVCNGEGPNDPNNPDNGRAYFQLLSKTATQVTVAIVTLGATNVNWDDVDCIGIHD